MTTSVTPASRALGSRRGRVCSAALVAASLLCGVGFAPTPASARQPQSSSSSASTAPNPTKKRSTRRRHRRRREPAQKAPTPDRIREIQSALSRNGYYQDEPTGKWDTHTVAAMRKFQDDNGLEPTGKLDALSLQKLGLGSDIAGVSAPKQIPPPPSLPPAAPPASSADPSSGGSKPPQK